MASLPEKIAHCALAKFDSLPQNCKPRTLSDGRREWTPMSAVVLAKDQGAEGLICLSLATGTKCLAASAIPKCQGMVLHDSHAEILALRGFNRWILNEVQRTLATPACASPYLEVTATTADFMNITDSGMPREPLFKLKDSLSIHLFTTEAPCGDASMEILMNSFPPNSAIPWSTNVDTSVALQGRGHFSLLGHVRRKPARADAEASLSKSCTDKLAVKQFTSLLSFPADLFVQKTRTAYLESLVVYSDQYNVTGYKRAFGLSGRLSPVRGDSHFFRVEPLPASFPRFAFDRALQTPLDGVLTKCKTSNISAFCMHATGEDGQDHVEVLINGVKQGYKQWDHRANKASTTSRSALWSLALEISGSSRQHEPREKSSFGPDIKDKLVTINKALSANTYDQAKASCLRAATRNRKTQVTNALGSWTSNLGDGDWSCRQLPPVHRA